MAKKEMEWKGSFEEALSRLEQIVSMLEEGKAGLDESLEAYEEGVKLVKYCHDTLNKAEQRVRILIKNEEGEMTEEPFSPSEG
ncbi:MAG: exodeoxyribonuclease VII small subunit [Clostridia bacterium]|nr:exodeoxyribonuclease VII small subunit [Clostridia bacterium]